MRRLLVVEDDAVARASLVRFLQPFHEVAAAHDVDSALVLLTTHVPCGVVADLTLGNGPGNGFDVLRAARKLLLGVPLAIATGSCATSTINEAASLGAAYLAKPDYAISSLLPFLDLVAAREAGVGHLAQAITAVATLWGLARRQRQLLPWLAARCTPEEICALAGYEHATYKSHVKALLQRSGFANTAELVIETYRIATGAMPRPPRT